MSFGSAPLVTLYIELLISSVAGESHVTCICSTNETTKGQETTSFGSLIGVSLCKESNRFDRYI